ncbi:MAG: acyltransferase [Coriobacteriaceae bacterium]|nr:acyltransferase [Coriobacteriaceae bacterium]
MRFKLDIISQHRGAIYGFSILWIMVFHGHDIDGIDYSFGIDALQPLQDFINAGNVGVDIFLFLSSVCLYFSFFKNPDTYAFIKKRFARIFVPALLIFIVYWTYLLVTSGAWGLYVLRLTLLSFWVTGDTNIWFVSLIVILYLLYPFVFRWLFSGKHPFVRLLVLLAVTYLLIFSLSVAAPEFYDSVEVALTRFPVFIVGCWAGKYVYEKKEVNPAWFALVVVAVVAFFFVKVNSLLPEQIYTRLFYMVGGISLAYALAAIFHGCSLLHRKSHKSVLDTIFAFFGAFSLELYLAHMMCNKVYRLIFPAAYEGWVAGYFVMLLCAAIIAFAAYKIDTPIIRRLTGRNKKLPEAADAVAQEARP